MVTLTQPAPRGLSERRLEAALRLQRSLWKDAATRMRWWEHRSGRGDVDAADKIPPPRLSDGTPHPEYASTWDESTGDWPYPELGTDGYVWALELTTGQAGDRWHLHRHVIVPSLAMAERVNAAWQAAVAGLEIPGHGWARTSIDKMSGYYAAWYVSKYVTGKCETDDVPENRHLAYRRVMSGCQRYNAGGANRPLGIAPAPSSDPVIAVEIPGFSPRAQDRIWPAAEFFSGEASCWAPRAEVELADDWRPVVDKQTELEDAVDAAAELRSIKASQRASPLGTHPEARAP